MSVVLLELMSAQVNGFARSAAAAIMGPFRFVSGTLEMLSRSCLT